MSNPLHVWYYDERMGFWVNGYVMSVSPERQEVAIDCGTGIIHIISVFDIQLVRP